MKIYWDSSALLNAIASKKVFDRFDPDQHTTRSHAFVEGFSHLTGRGLPMRDGTRQKITPSDGFAVIAALARRLSFRDLSPAETLQILELAQRRGVQGARIHDLLHARAAALSGSEKILTRDLTFASLGESIPTEWP